MAAVKHAGTFDRYALRGFARCFPAPVRAVGLALALLLPALAAAQNTPPKPTLTVEARDASVLMKGSVTSDGGSPILRWEYQKKTTGSFGVSWTRIPYNDANTLNYIVSDLSNDTTYTFRARAVNANGEGLTSDEKTATPVVFPSKKAATPTIGTVGAVSSSGTLSVPWSWSDNECAIEGYRIQYRKSSEPHWRAAPNTARGGQYHIDLVSPEQYTFSTTTIIGPKTIGTGSGEDGVSLDRGVAYDVRIRVTPAGGKCNDFSEYSSTASSPAQNRAPTVASAIADQTVTVSGTTEVALGSVFSDPDNDALTLSASSGATHKATVSISGTTLTINGVAAGTTTITVTASDGNLSVSDTFNVKVNGAPTVASAIADQTVAVGGTTTVALGSVFSDPNDDTLTLTASSSATGTATVAINNNTLTITGVVVGTATITVTASDGSLSVSDTFEVTVTAQPVPNRAPVVAEAIADQSVMVDETTTVALASVFSDPDGDTLTLTASSGATDKATVSLSGTTLTITGIAAGTATITVTASDGSLSVTDTFDITVTTPPPPNRAPVVAERDSGPDGDGGRYDDGGAGLGVQRSGR